MALVKQGTWNQDLRGSPLVYASLGQMELEIVARVCKPYEAMLRNVGFSQGKPGEIAKRFSGVTPTIKIIDLDFYTAAEVVDAIIKDSARNCALIGYTLGDKTHTGLHIIAHGYDELREALGIALA